MYLGKFNLNTINKTKDIACLLYKLCKVGDVIGLYGDIGAGKTTFVRYFINQGIKKAKYLVLPIIFILNMNAEKVLFIIWMLGE